MDKHKQTMEEVYDVNQAEQQNMWNKLITTPCLGNTSAWVWYVG